ncbi:MAG TPA: SAM-dependent methyltransferase [Chitinophagaceae bacterium]|jgi:16S rRNA (cytidine1402-2'-O)-methyltransferase|nr:SAM-dependent methyltransferase [Chitinophagaceae bacterium]
MGTVYLLPSLLHEEGLAAIPPYILDAVKQCQVLFVENERTARRFLKQLDRSIIIDNFEWFVSDGKDTATSGNHFRQKIKEGKTIGLISEAGCPGVADPGQELVAIAQEMKATVKPLVGPNSLLLALMASGMNGQQFRFNGYLPIDAQQRSKTLRELENESEKKDCTQLFIETPYRNHQLMEAIIKNCKPSTRLCIAVNLTGPDESIKTMKLSEWQKSLPEIHKKPAIFLLYAGK